MQLANCNFCDWTEKKKGVWAAHYASRDHLRTAHPEHHSAMLAEEEKAAKILRDSRNRFGQAVWRD
jgi:hypothetical protein